MDNTTAVWINALRNAQKAIRTAILGKGVQITGDLSSYPDAINQLKNPQGSKSISTNGTHDVADVAEAVVTVPQISTSSRTFTANGTYQADSGTAWDNIAINVPSSGIVPSGTENISQNGLYDITNKAYVNVAVPVGVFPSGALGIDENGSYDVTNKQTVNVNVPKGAEVITGQVSGSGSKILTIPAIVGKDNVVVTLISTTSSNLSVSTIVGAGYVGGNMYMTYKNSSNITRLSTTASYDKGTGRISYTGSNSFNFSNNTNFKYLYIAW